MISGGSKSGLGRRAAAAEKFRESADQFLAQGVIEPDALEPLLWTLPVVDMMKRVGATLPTGKTFCGAISAIRGGLVSTYGDRKIDVPALFINSWGDFGVNETLFEFNFFRDHAQSDRSATNQFVIVSPRRTSRVGRSPTVVGVRDLGDAQRILGCI
jgi:hypothetical protein